MDFYKAKTNKSCADMFNFLRPRLIMTQTMELAKLPLLGKTSKPLPSKQNCKKEGFFKLRKRGFHRKSVRRIEKKINMKTSLQTFETTQGNTKALRKTNWNWTLQPTRKKRNNFILRLAFRIKQSDLLQDSRKSSRKMI